MNTPSKKMPTSVYSPRPKTGKRAYDESNWSLGWEKSPKSTISSPTSSIKQYHNQSNLKLEDKFMKGEDNKKAELKKRKADELNSKLPSFDPRDGHKSNIVFGNEKPQTLHTQMPTSPRMPPGGRSQIIFG